MPATNPMKPKRQKKKKSRTEVSSDSESDTPKDGSVKKSAPSVESASSLSAVTSSSNTNNEKIRADFSQHYMQRITSEFAEDLDKIRGAEDFKGVESVEVLIRALRQGVEGWNEESMKRVIGDQKL